MKKRLWEIYARVQKNIADPSQLILFTSSTWGLRLFFEVELPPSSPPPHSPRHRHSNCTTKVFRVMPGQPMDTLDPASTITSSTKTRSRIERIKMMKFLFVFKSHQSSLQNIFTSSHRIASHFLVMNQANLRACYLIITKGGN